MTQGYLIIPLEPDWRASLKLDGARAQADTFRLARRLQAQQGLAA